MDIMIKGILLGFGIYQASFILFCFISYMFAPFFAMIPLFIFMYAVLKSDWLFLKIFGSK